MRPDRDGTIAGYEGLNTVQQRHGDGVLDTHLPEPGTPETQPVEAGYMANAWVRMCHPDYDRVREMLDEVDRARASYVTEPLAWRVARPPLTVGALDAERAGEPFPIADGTCTFAFIGAVISVHLAECPPTSGSSRWPTACGGRSRWPCPRAPPQVQAHRRRQLQDRFVEDPLNPTTARHPFGANSVCEAAGYVDPDGRTTRDPEHPPDAWATWCSTARRSVAGPARRLPPGGIRRPPRRRPVPTPGGARRRGLSPLYAALAAVLDNLIADGRLQPLVAVLLYPDERLVEYADDPRHHTYLARELVPHLERELPLVAAPSARCLMGASFGAVATLSATPAPFGRLLVQSGSPGRYRLLATSRRPCGSR